MFDAVAVYWVLVHFTPWRDYTLGVRSTEGGQVLARLWRVERSSFRRVSASIRLALPAARGGAEH